MSDLTALKERVIRLLADALPGCDVLDAFPQDRFSPLGRSAVAVSLDAIALAPAGLSGFGGGLSPENPAAATIVFRLDLYEPGSGGALHGLYETVCGAFLSEAAAIGLTGIDCDSPRREEPVRAWHLPAKATLRGALTRLSPPGLGPEEGVITQVEIRREP